MCWKRTYFKGKPELLCIQKPTGQVQSITMFLTCKVRGSCYMSILLKFPHFLQAIRSMMSLDKDKQRSSENARVCYKS
uniref:Uncharacterized protein n=1 Tax=Anguilla anguilla TaxID=7936 RepID=A0A0E9XBE4_ANGAN